MKNFLLAAFTLIAFSACHESIEEKASREAKDFTNKNCPTQLSEGIMIDSMTYENPTRTLHYYYSISGDKDTTIINQYITNDDFIKQVKNNASIRKYKEEKFNFAYTFYSTKNKGQKLIDVIVTPKLYDDTKQ